MGDSMKWMFSVILTLLAVSVVGCKPHSETKYQCLDGSFANLKNQCLSTNCPKQEPCICPEVTPAPEPKLSDLGDKRQELKKQIDSLDGPGMPSTSIILIEENDLYVEYTTWESGRSVFHEMQRIVSIIVDSLENQETPEAVTLKAISIAKTTVDEIQTTILTWNDLEKMANLELSYTTWKEKTRYETSEKVTGK